jgi:hypothetical protein
MLRRSSGRGTGPLLIFSALITAALAGVHSRPAIDLGAARAGARSRLVAELDTAASAGVGLVDGCSFGNTRFRVCAARFPHALGASVRLARFTRPAAPGAPGRGPADGSDKPRHAHIPMLLPLQTSGSAAPSSARRSGLRKITGPHVAALPLLVPTMVAIAGVEAPLGLPSSRAADDPLTRRGPPAL